MKKLTSDDALLGLAASVTERACELIQDGWVKGTMQTNVDGSPASFCIHGALNVALEEVFGSTSHRTLASREVEDVAVAFICDEAFGRMHSHSGGIPAASYNDAQERRHDEVLGVLSRASERLWDLTVEQETAGSNWIPSKWAEVDTQSEQAQQYLHASLN